MTIAGSSLVYNEVSCLGGFPSFTPHDISPLGWSLHEPASLFPTSGDAQARPTPCSTCLLTHARWCSKCARLTQTCPLFPTPFPTGGVQAGPASNTHTLPPPPSQQVDLLDKRLAPPSDLQPRHDTCKSATSPPQQVVSKLGLLDTSRTAWESDVHDIVWKGLKKEYELEQRFENLLKKVRGERLGGRGVDERCGQVSAPVTRLTRCLLV